MTYTEYPNEQLSGVERRLLSVCSNINERPVAKELQRRFLTSVGRRWVRACTRNLQDVRGLENAHALQPERGVIVCSNHRSFFDMYVIASVMFCARIPWYRHQLFPVRSEYFYETWQGLGLNLLMGGGSMYPPIFRDKGKAELNKISVDKIIDFLAKPGSVVGVHPEGTRNQAPELLPLLRAQPGVGQMALQSGAPVLPIWIHGLGNNLPKQLAANFAPPSRRGEPIVIRVGAPVDLDDLRVKKPRVTLYKRAADRILGDIRALGEAAIAEG